MTSENNIVEIPANTSEPSVQSEVRVQSEVSVQSEPSVQSEVSVQSEPIVQSLSSEPSVQSLSSEPSIPSIPDITDDPETVKFMHTYLNKITELNNKDFELSSKLKSVVNNLDTCLQHFDNLSMDEMYEISGHVTKNNPNNFILLHIVGVITGQQFQKTKQS